MSPGWGFAQGFDHRSRVVDGMKKSSLDPGGEAGAAGSGGSWESANVDLLPVGLN